MAADAKSIAFMGELKEALAARLAVAVTDAFDSNGDATLKVGTGAAGAVGVFVRIKTQPWASALDSLGLAAPTYTPHVIQVVFEGISGAGVDPNGLANKMKILGELAARGTLIEVYERANGTGPAVTDITSGNLKTIYAPSRFYGLMGAV